jgi:predicted RNA-binding Zn ribbon-like protein
MSTSNIDITGMKIIARQFSAGDLVGGHPALDLINTITARDTPVPIDWLDSYSRLLEWSLLARIADETSIRGLDRQAARTPREADQALERIKHLREALHDVYVALVEGKRAPRVALEQLETVWKSAQGHRHLLQAEDRIKMRLDTEDSGLDWIRDFIVICAVDLLQDLPHGRARICQGERCGWVFVDTSKGGQRVWCDMAVCGNAAKSRRHLKKRKASRKRP